MLCLIFLKIIENTWTTKGISHRQSREGKDEWVPKTQFGAKTNKKKTINNNDF